MPEMRLDFDLTSQLVLTTSFLHLMFEDHFECHDKLASLFSRQVDVSEFSLS
jgi:hypothetical protein